MGDNGKAYSTVTPALIDRIRALCGAADLILPNYTEAQILLQRQPQTELLTDEAAQALADELTALAPGLSSPACRWANTSAVQAAEKTASSSKSCTSAAAFPAPATCTVRCSLARCCRATP